MSLGFLFDERFEDVFKVFQDPYVSGRNTKVSSFDDHWLITMVAPGLNKEDFKVSVDDSSLTISYDVSSRKDTFAETKKATQSWTIDKNKVLLDEISSVYEQGILRVKIPKQKPSKTFSKREIPVL